MKKPPIMTKRGSYKIEVMAGEAYHYCNCGLSNNQPFCDNSVQNPPCNPMLYVSDSNKIVGFCGCRQSKVLPLCDGAHKQLPEIG